MNNPTPKPSAEDAPMKILYEDMIQGSYEVTNQMIIDGIKWRCKQNDDGTDIYKFANEAADRLQAQQEAMEKAAYILNGLPCKCKVKWVCERCKILYALKGGNGE